MVYKNYESILPEKHRGRIRSNVQEELRKVRPDKNDIEDIKTIKKLKNDERIACIQSDKTGKIIIMNRTEYIQKMETEIERMNVIKIEKDPNKKFGKRVEEIIKNGKWPNEKRAPIKNHAPNTPRAFGKLKDHKTPPSMRVIVNRKEGPSYMLEKFMADIYKELSPPPNAAYHQPKNLLKEYEK